MMINKDQALLILNLLATVQFHLPLSPAELELRDQIFEYFPDFKEQFKWIGKTGH